MSRSSPSDEVPESSAAIDDDEPVVDYSPDGVDRTLIYESLRRTPAERLRMLQGFVDSVWALRNGARPAR